MTRESEPAVERKIEIVRQRLNQGNYAVADLMLKLIDEDTEADMNRRSVNYIMLMGLGARACREAYVVARPQSGRQPTTELIFGLPAHQFYMQLLGKTVDHYMSVENGGSERTESAMAGIYDAFYPFVRQSAKSSRRNDVTPQRFYNGLVDTMLWRQQFFDEGRPLSIDERVGLLVFDKAARTITEKAFRESVKPFSSTGIHLPEHPYPYLYPELVVNFCDPAYWNNRDTTMTNRPRSGFHDRVFTAWAGDEHRYWQQRLEVGNLQDITRQIQELSPARH